MITIQVPDMMCENCVKRMTHALQEANLRFEISLAEKTVSIDGDQSDAQTAISELEDLGFTPSI